MTANWAILRQLVLAADDALDEGARIAGALNLPDGFADPQLVEIDLHDYVMPVGPQKYLEVVGPLNEQSYINRWLHKVGGSGGYCLSVQVPDAPACKERALASGVRVVADQVLQGHPLIQLHPADVGILLELDGVRDPDVWFWDDVTPGPHPNALIDDIVHVVVGAPDPEATAKQWAYLIGLEPVSPTTLDFTGCIIELIENPVGQVLAATFQLTPGATPPQLDELLGMRVSFRPAISAGPSSLAAAAAIV